MNLPVDASHITIDLLVASEPKTNDSSAVKHIPEVSFICDAPSYVQMTRPELISHNRPILSNPIEIKYLEDLEN